MIEFLQRHNKHTATCANTSSAQLFVASLPKFVASLPKRYADSHDHWRPRLNSLQVIQGILRNPSTVVSSGTAFALSLESYSAAANLQNFHMQS